MLFGLSWDGPEPASSWNIESREKISTTEQTAKSKTTGSSQLFGVESSSWPVLPEKDQCGKLGVQAVGPTSHPGSRYGHYKTLCWGLREGVVLVFWLESDGYTGLGQVECTAGSSKHTITVQEHSVLENYG